MRKRTIFTLIAVLCGIALIAGYMLLRGSSSSEQPVSATEDIITNEQILGVLQSQAQIASTEVTIRKMGIYDSDSDKVSLNPNTWKIGHRLCVIPVDIKIKYGIDLNDMTSGDIARPDSSNVVLIRLPQPKILDKSFIPQTNKKEMVSLATGLRDDVGESTIQQVKTLAFADVVEKDQQLYQKLQTEITANTKTVFKSLLKSMGLEAEFIN
ncbi:MAG: DUF4230 domain-containing protein [Bacteroidaceae bacterium]|nr:DUF4230 domain-containing protein [Bacteroidaceae bacterium]